ncbi:uncharacterized protein LOC108485950 [Gossypium arboreum]|uniref:Uncharacterized protein n=1 Tax=Gossypium arboreum TaxID=29729 RepID=A0ABR0PNV7_GOSAR|nr:uncharacterized protein LOC108485950 [Gossypium arboreum]KAK5826048.1 hypothetical protein PVK06_020954 [Gossypium arboreum]
MENSAKKMNSENKYRTIAVTVTPFIILGGICIGLGWRYVSRAWNRKPKPKLARSMSFSALHGGKLAFERLVDYHNHGGKSTNIDADIKKLEELLADENPRFKEIQRVLARLEMSRKEDEAMEVLNKALEKARKQGKPHEVYELEILLAELYIYKGDVQQALNCKCLVEDGGDSDARRPLYKAIICLMDQREEEARKYWQDFKDVQHMTIPPCFHEDEFTEFKNAVNLLKKDIDATKQ